MKYGVMDWFSDKIRGKRPLIDGFLREPVLDVGSGSGDRSQDAHVCVDPSLHHCAVTARMATSVQSVCQNLPFANAVFGTITCFHVIEHLPPDVVVRFFFEASRVLKPEGSLILESPMPNRNFWDTIDHYKPYTPKAIRKHLNRGKYKQTYDAASLEPLAWFVYGDAPRFLSPLGHFIADGWGVNANNFRMVLKKLDYRDPGISDHSF